MAAILGWKKARVEQIALKCVPAEAVKLARVERIRRNGRRKRPCKRGLEGPLRGP